MSIYQMWEKVPGATKEEVELISRFTRKEICNNVVVRHKGKEYPLTRPMLKDFLDGKVVPKLFRDKIIQYVYEKSEKQAERARKIKGS